MLKSMTGYGRGEAGDRIYGEFFVEIQGVNRKYCDINMNLPKHLLMLESNVRESILENITRGRINVFVGQTKMADAHKLFVNKKLVQEYFQILKILKKELKLKGELDISLIGGLKDFIIQAEPSVNAIKLWPVILKALKTALKNFNSMREKEGRMIYIQIEKQLNDIEHRVNEIESQIPQLAGDFRGRLNTKLKEACLSVSSDDERIQKEIAILAEHTDITEEINRMRSHLVQFRALTKKNTAAGRTLDFLVQEMMREMNTMGSKALHKDISSQVVYVKGELEKIREQIQNVE